MICQTILYRKFKINRIVTFYPVPGIGIFLVDTTNQFPLLAEKQLMLHYLAGNISIPLLSITFPLSAIYALLG
jgi:hypothetical protein